MKNRQKVADVVDAPAPVSALAEYVPEQGDALFQVIPVEMILESPMNPRKHFDPLRMAELEQSIRAKGVLTPLLARPHPAGGGLWEIAAGHRRFRAAKAAGLLEVPVVVRKMDDAAFLEVLVIENQQREDVHPLEEAAGYKALMLNASYTVERLAERMAKSVKYIYDRVKLLELSPDAQALFLAGRMTAGHAILLARLSHADQARAIGSAAEGFIGGGLFVHDDAGLFDEAESKDPLDEVKPASVRELQHWIDKHVRFVPVAPDPMLFPETAAVLQQAEVEAEKVVQVTHEYHVPPELKDGTRVIGPMSWKRADGSSKDAPACDAAVTGVVVFGAERGAAFKVCTDKKGCSTHWKYEQRQAKQRAAGNGGSAAKERERAEREQAKYEAERKREDEDRARWEKARPALLQAFADRIKKHTASAGGALADLLVAEARISAPGLAALEKYLGRGRTAEDLVRWLAFLVVAGAASDRWSAPRQLTALGKALGLNAAATVKAATAEGEAPPAEKAAAPGKGAAKAQGALKRAAGRKVANRARRGRAQASA